MVGCPHNRLGEPSPFLGFVLGREAGLVRLATYFFRRFWGLIGSLKKSRATLRTSRSADNTAATAVAVALMRKIDSSYMVFQLLRAMLVPPVVTPVIPMIRGLSINLRYKALMRSIILHQLSLPTKFINRSRSSVSFGNPLSEDSIGSLPVDGSIGF